MQKYGIEHHNYSHGMTGTKIHTARIMMKQRCNNKNIKYYRHYGGRGITYDPKRENFEEFYKDMWKGHKEGLSLDRIDNNGNYCKENCRWAIKKEQQNNTRYCNNIEYNGKQKTMSEFEDELGFIRGTLSDRIKRRGWDVKRAIETPIQKKYRNRFYKKTTHG